MRLAPVSMYYAQDELAVFQYAGESTRTTHGAREAIECSRLFGLQLRAAGCQRMPAACISSRIRPATSASAPTLAAQIATSQPTRLSQRCQPGDFNGSPRPS